MKMIAKSMAVCLALTAGVATVNADWPNQNPTKWIQPPDTSTLGLDIAMGSGRMIADDWMCLSPLPVTDIHIWASWLYDQFNPNATLTVSIWSDAAGTPGSRLWQEVLTPDRYTVRKVYAGIREGYYDPVTGQFVTASVPGDTEVYQYNFTQIAPFHQTVSNIYWLSVSADVEGIGWKSTNPRLFEGGWGEAGVYENGGPFMSLSYPSGHPIADFPFPLPPEMKGIDLAFAITVPEPGTIALFAALGAGGLLLLRRRK